MSRSTYIRNKISPNGNEINNNNFSLSFMTKLGAMRDKENSIRNRLQDCENSLYSLDKLEVPELYLLQENKVVMETKHQVGESQDVLYC